MLTIYMLLSVFVLGVITLWWSTRGFLDCVIKMFLFCLTSVGVYQIITNPTIEFLIK
ncbi:hypothetical protein AsFcp4_271 [Aeromonas phage AsFcp_4]|uniref:Uncharacterized protein n=1 Tax=Aeromonas phage PX29 TaxID=926067 RepID=E5DQ47_9CAUD|nr:hypothetical protein CL89_gp114 [Aeromonas phage PX29]ADQ52833.1 conserved hypothetical protein [Aeromonas phage PX29]QAX98380.1 hypothetical protein ASfcp2_34 [Aeromonas phage AsFcp_2]QAX99723.1 hypothetical protein AsFcp4_271 [Aeromonas phage AsFcp_4]